MTVRVRRGRPPLPPSERRNRRLSVRLTGAELLSFQRQARKAGYKRVSQYLLRLVAQPA
jgi:hypothetical protein